MFDYYKPSLVKLALNLWPPFWGAGIKIILISDDFRYVRLQLKLRWWNKNANRTQYGGSIFSLTDPVYSLMLMGILGKQYFIWDKQANIEFIQPGDGDLFADFVISEACIAEIIAATAEGNKYLPEFSVSVSKANNDVVAQVTRILYVRKKPQYRSDMMEPSSDIKMEQVE
ncbi:DUF4442 domain-containing protein [Photobacterium phosphoreum]|uniref:DUF4442 domain-containing protein n=1 Tax=Photobacterium phosphoreum TaxID=659 RepID=UPI000D155BEF|nr:DUF4442 domain-containing protein [Photobacterium phosphoreum]PSU83688.1 DUF4442 domain-containing protein [Photobacterium phosphoreum]